MMPEVVQSLSTARAVSLNHQFTFQARNQLTEALAHMAGHGSAASYVARLRARTSVVTLLAGSGTRWEESVRLAKELGAFQENWEPGTPRALFPIDDILRPGQKIPIGGYTLRAARELGKHIVVTSGTHDERIEQELVSPLNLSASFVTQEKYGDTVNAAGHADAMWQSKDAWQDSEYVIVNFGGNANARATLISSLMLLDLLNKEKETCGEIVPVTQLERAAYPISVDMKGFPNSFVHPKLDGLDVTSTDYQELCRGAYSNVGVRVFRSDWLYDVLKTYYEHYFDQRSASYRALGEFALDHVDRAGTCPRMVRILHCAEPAEILAEAKKFGVELEDFSKLAEEVLARDRRSGFFL